MCLWNGWFISCHLKRHAPPQRNNLPGWICFLQLNLYTFPSPCFVWRHAFWKCGSKFPLNKLIIVSVIWITPASPLYSAQLPHLLLTVDNLNLHRFIWNCARGRLCDLESLNCFWISAYSSWSVTFKTQLCDNRCEMKLQTALKTVDVVSAQNGPLRRAGEEGCRYQHDQSCTVVLRGQITSTLCPVSY